MLHPDQSLSKPSRYDWNSFRSAPSNLGAANSNSLLVLGGGIEVPYSTVHLIVGARWLHVSNNGREGNSRKPDIQSLGGFVGVGWRF